MKPESSKPCEQGVKILSPRTFLLKNEEKTLEQVLEMGPAKFCLRWYDLESVRHLNSIVAIETSLMKLLSVMMSRSRLTKGSTVLAIPCSELPITVAELRMFL